MKKLLSLSLLAIGCASPADDAQDGVPEPEPEPEGVAAVSSALQSPIYTNAGDTSGVRLFNTSAGFCYLTGISGNLSRTDPGSWQIFANPTYLSIRDGAWYLHAGAGTAQARCAWWHDFSSLGPNRLFTAPEGFVLEGADPRATASLWDDRSLCYLGRAVELKYPTDRVSITRGAGAWQLAVASAFGFTRGGAMCINTGRGAPFRLKESSPGNTSFTWMQGHPDTWMMSASQGVCMLTGIAGAFRGAGEGIEIIEQDGWYRLRGHSLQSGVRAEAQCVTWDQLVLSAPVRLAPIGFR